MSLRQPQENLRLTCPSCEQKLDASGIPAFEEISCPNCSFVFPVPFRFGQYLLEEAIDESRFAGVYRAQDLKLRRQVAVKILFEEVAGDVEIINLFLGAARRTAILNHVNILPIYSCDCHEGLPFIVMEYMAGTCLYRGLYTLEQMLPVANCIHYCEMAARGLDAAHKENINHDGLRPTNLLWDGFGNIKICDFGMLKFKRISAEKLDVDWREFLHCGYTSPEILLGESKGGLASDIFGLGTTLYHLLTGRRPFSNTIESRMENLEITPPPPQELRSEVPAALSHYVMRMIALDPVARPHSYREIISTFFNLREGLEENTPPAASSSAGKRKITSKRSLPAHPVASSRRRGGAVRRRKKTSFFPAFLVLALIGIIGMASVFAVIFREQLLTTLGFPVTPADEPLQEATEPVHITSPAVVVNRPVPLKKRPIPADLDFSPQNHDLRMYLTNLPPKLKRQEAERIQILNGVLPHIRQMMQYLPYQGIHGVRLRSGRVIQGTIPLCNDEGVSIKDQGGTMIHVAWNELSPRQYGIFLEFYIEQREGRGPLKAKERTALARDYLMLALLCDWLKEDARAVLYARETISTDEKTGQRVRDLLPYLPL